MSPFGSNYMFDHSFLGVPTFRPKKKVVPSDRLFLNSFAHNQAEPDREFFYKKANSKKKHSLGSPRPLLDVS